MHFTYTFIVIRGQHTIRGWRIFFSFFPTCSCSAAGVRVTGIPVEIDFEVFVDLVLETLFAVGSVHRIEYCITLSFTHNQYCSANDVGR